MQQFLLTVFVALGISGFSQLTSKKYVDGILYFQLKQNAAHKIPSGSEGQTNLKDFAFLGDIISRYQVTEIRKSFYMAKDEKLLRTYKVFFNNVNAADAFVAELEKKNIVEYAERLPVFKLSYVPNDPYYNYTTVYSGYTLNWKWHLDKINAAQAWDISKGSATIKVAITDNAIYTTHPDLQSKIVAMRDEADLDNDPNPPATATGTVAYEWSHGTHVSGLVGAQSDNGVGIASLGYNVSLVAVKIGRNSDGALIAGYEGVTWASTTGQADVINMSWGGPTGGTTAQNVINAAYAQGCVLVAAAGNDGTTGNPTYFPASFTNCIAVGATNSDDTKADFSEYGTWVDVCAPGGNQLIGGVYFTPLASTTFNTTLGLNTYYGLPNSTLGPGKYDGMQGTSMASPIVSALAGLILSVNPAMTQAQVRNCIISTADNINSVNGSFLGQIGSGRINAQAALQCAQATASVAPTVSFTGSPLSICPGSTVSFTNTTVSSGATTYTWTFQGGTPATSTQTNVTVTYNTPGVYSVTLAATNPYGSNSGIQTGYVTVTSAAILPLVEGFQSATYPPTNWTLVDDGSDNIKWALKTTTGQASTQSTFFDNYNDAADAGFRDQLKTYVNLTGFTSAKMTFYRAYSATFASPNLDSLQIGISLNCGSSITSAYLKGGPSFSTAVNTSSTAAFSPTVSTQWKKDSIDLTPYVGQSNVMIAFINRGHYGDNLYLDNINITGVAGASPVAAITSASTGCTGTAITLTDASTGSPTSWVWSMPGGTPTSSGTQNTSVTYATAGVKTISLTVANGSGTTTATKTITITAVPTVTASVTNTTICSGTSVTVNVGGATGYTWSPSGSGTSSVLSPTTTTVYSITGSNGSCTGAAVNVTVNVTTTPTVSAASTTICSGGTTTLTASGATTYTWLPSGTGATKVVSPASTTVYTVNGSNGTCIGTAKTVTVTVTGALVLTVTPTSTTICSGSTTTLTASGATTYTWLPSGSGSSNAVSPSSTTVYTVTGSSGSCFTSPVTTTVTVTASPVLTVTPTNTAICSGGAVTVSASGATTYTWLPSGSGTSSVLSPAATTIYSITGSNGTCASAVKTVTVNVTTTPTVSASASPATICAGQTSTITASGATTYSWMPGAQTTTVIAVSPSSTTIYTVTGMNGSCNSTGTVSVNVTAAPTVTASLTNTTICSGTPVTVTVGGATTYTWLPSGSGTSSVLSPTATTVYSITGSNGGCASAVKTVTINVTTTPTVGASASPATICAGQSSTITASGATTYSWMPGAQTTTVITVNPASTTIYTVTGMNGSCSSTRTILVNVTAAPTVTASVTNTTICSGTGVTVTVGGATTYTWLPSGSGTSSVLSPAATTVYSITGSNGGCASAIRTVTINVTATPTIGISASPATICSGQSTTLTASGATTYSWMPGSQTTTVITVSPTTSTAYTVIGMNGSCSANSAISVNVTATPTVNTSVTNTTVCNGTPVTVSLTGAISYTWSPSGSGSTSVLMPSATTVYTINGMFGGCNSVPKTFTINVNPSPVVNISTSPSTICAGQSVTLTASGAGSYSWLPGAQTTSVIVVSPSATTSYSVTGTTAGCSSDAGTTVNVNSSSSLIASVTNTSICAGTSVPVNVSGGTTYSWLPSGSGSSGNLSPASTTVYTVSSTGACGAASVTFTINVVTAPVVNASASTTICAGATTTISATGATSYTWLPVTGLSGNTGSSVAASPASSLVYTVTGSNGACATTQTVSVAVTLCTGIKGLAAGSLFNVYPNPSMDLFTVSSPGNSGKLNVSVMNTLGQVVTVQNSKDPETLVLDMSAYSKGVYYLKIEMNEGTRLVKVVLN
jgi:subtilisin family serine protease